MWLVLPFWYNVQGKIKQKQGRSAFIRADGVVGDVGGKGRKVREVRGLARNSDSRSEGESNSEKTKKRRRGWVGRTKW
jgi:hypothetical protein